MKTEKELTDFISKHPGTSFVELKRFIGEEFDGDYVWHASKPYNNIILWTGMSEQAIDLLAGAVESGLINIHGTSHLVYLIDGVSLNVPIAKKLKNYKLPRWFPAVFSVKKSADKAARSPE